MSVIKTFSVFDKGTVASIRNDRDIMIGYTVEGTGNGDDIFLTEQQALDLIILLGRRLRENKLYDTDTFYKQVYAKNKERFLQRII